MASASRRFPGSVPILSRLCLGYVSAMSRMCPGYVPVLSDGLPRGASFEHLHTQHLLYSCGSRESFQFRCPTKENGARQEIPKKIKEMTAPAGCVLCGGLKGSAAALAAGTLRAPVSVRGTVTKSAGRPRRRSRWEWPLRMKPPPQPMQKAALGRPFALAGVVGVSARQPQRPAAGQVAARAAMPATSRS